MSPGWPSTAWLPDAGHSPQECQVICCPAPPPLLQSYKRREVDAREKLRQLDSQFAQAVADIMGVPNPSQLDACALHVQEELKEREVGAQPMSCIAAWVCYPASPLALQREEPSAGSLVL